MKKERKVKATLAPRSCSRYFWQQTTNTWHESCSRDPQTHLNEFEFHASAPVADEYFTSMESIRYHNTYRVHGRRWKWNYCHHVKVRQPNFGSQGCVFTIQQVPKFREENFEFSGCGHYDFVKQVTALDHKFEFRLGPRLLPAADVIESIPEYDPILRLDSGQFYNKLDVLDRIAMDVMIPELETGFKLPVFLFELMELKPLIKSIFNFVSSVWLDGGTWNSIAQGADYHTAALASTLQSTPLQIASGTYLGQIFGLLPFLSDVRSLINKFLSQRDAVTKYLENANKRQTLHFQKGLAPGSFDPDFMNKFEYLIVADEFGKDWYHEVFSRASFYAQRINTEKLRYNATLDFEYRIEDVDSGLTRFLAEMDHWGLNVSVSDIWQAIPFSFILDWFWDVGSWLERFDFQNVPVTVEVFNFCRSLKGTRTTEYKLTGEVENLEAPSLYFVPSQWTVHPLSPTLRTECRSYIRLPGLPRQSTPEYWHLPNGWKLLTSCALLAVVQDAT